MKDGTQRGIREVRRNDRERKKARERRTLPPLLPPPLFHSFLGQQNVAKVGLKRQKWGDAMVRRKGGRQGLIGHVRQYILPSRSTHPPSLLFSCLAPSLTTLICFPLCVIRTRWIWLFSLASLLPDPPPPTTFLLPFSPWLCSFMTPHGFCHSVVSGKEVEIPSWVSISPGKGWGFEREKAWGGGSGKPNGPFSLPPFLAIYFPYLVCLLGWYFHFCWFVALYLDSCCKYHAAICSLFLLF